MMKLVQINELGETREIEILFMTPTAQQLWNDKEFWLKRLCDQFDYRRDVSRREREGQISEKRAFELWSSSYNVEERILQRLKELKNN